MTRPSVGKRETACLGALLLLLSAATSFAATISGKVTDAQTGSPLSAMVVAAYTPAGQLQGSATSDSTGRYSLTAPAGSFRVLAYDNAGVYATTFYGDASSFDTTAPVSGDASNVNFAMRRGGTVSGTVSTSSGSASGITVAAYNIDGSRRGFAITNAFGAYSLVLPPGNYKVAAYDEAGNFWPKFYSDQNSFTTAATVTVAAAQNSTVPFRLDAAAHIVGTVTDGDTSTVLSGMTVSAYDARGVLISSTSSDFNGTFNLKTPPGTFRVVVSDPRQTYATGYFGGQSFSTASDVTLTAGATRANVTVPLRRAGFISGLVTDTSKTPLAVTVAAYGLDGTLRATTHTVNGVFNLTLAPGDYKLAAYDEQLVFATQFYSMQKTFAAADVVTVSSGTTPGPVRLFILSRGARITGTTLDSQTGLPLGGITVGAYDADGNLLSTGTTSANGQYAIVVPAGAYRLVASDSALQYAASFAGGASYETARVFTEVEGAVDSANLTLTRGIAVSGTVRDASGAPISGVEIAAIDPNGNHAGTSTSTDNGSFTILLLPNQYRFVIRDPHSRYATYSTPPVSVSRDTAVPPIAVTLTSSQRHRSVRH